MKDKRPELKPYLLKWINTHGGVWHKKVDLYFVGDEIEFGAEYVGRCLRDLAEEEKIKVDYYDGHYVKGLAKYSSLDTTEPIKVVQKPTMIIKDGMPVMVFN